MRYHTLGFCFKDCKMAASRNSLNGEEAKTMAECVKGARNARKDYRDKLANSKENGDGGRKVNFSEGTKEEKGRS